MFFLMKREKGELLSNIHQTIFKICIKLFSAGSPVFSVDSPSKTFNLALMACVETIL